MGRQESAIYIGAVALGAVIFNFIYWSFAFLRMGTTGLTAQAYGKKDATQMINILGRALALALIGAILLIVLQILIGQMSVYLLGASNEVETIAQEYFYIRIWAAPATLCLYVLMGWFFGMQNSIYPLILTIFINIINIVCNVYFVNYLGMKASGVALGTVIAQYSGFVLGLGLFWYKYSYLIASFQRQAILEWQSFKAFMALNSDIFIRPFCLVFALAFFENQSAILGDLTLAANGILLQLILWVSYGVDGFAYASESLIGKYHGAKEQKELDKAIKYSFYWGMGLAIVYSLLYALLGENLLYIFTNQEEIVLMAMPFLIWVIIFPIISTPAYIWDGIYIGMTASKAMRNTMVGALAIYLTFFFLQYKFTNWGNDGLWASLILLLISRGLMQWKWYREKMKV